MIKREKRDYKNGISHTHYHVPFLKTLSMIFYVRAGSSDEREEKNYGISHYLEHMLFNGSEKFPDHKQNDKELAKMGVIQNAWTNVNLTTYHMVLPTEVMGSAYEILHDRVFNPLLRDTDTEKERGIILEELAMGENSPLRTITHAVAVEAYAGTTYAHKVIGTEDSLKGMTSQYLRDYHNLYYSPNNMSFVTYGGATLEEVERIVADSLEKLQPAKLPKYDIILDKQSQGKREVEIRKDVESAFYERLSSAPKPTSLNEYISLLVIGEFLSGGQASLFEQELCIKESLAAEQYVYFYIGRDFTEFDLTCVLSESNLDKVRSKSRGLISDLRDIFTNEQFERARNYLYGEYIRSVESVKYPLRFECNTEILNFMLGSEYSIEAALSEIKSIRYEDVRAKLEQFTDNSNAFEGVLVPQK